MQTLLDCNTLYSSTFLEEEVYLVVVERLVGVDGHEDCGKAEGVVVDQEESDDGDHDLHDGGEDGDGHAER